MDYELELMISRQNAAPRKRSKFAKMPEDMDPFGKAPAGEVAPASDGGEMFAKFLALQGMAKDPNQAMSNLMPSQLKGFY